MANTPTARKKAIPCLRKMRLRRTLGRDIAKQEKNRKQLTEESHAKLNRLLDIPDSQRLSPEAVAIRTDVERLKTAADSRMRRIYALRARKRRIGNGGYMPKGVKKSS